MMLEAHGLGRHFNGRWLFRGLGFHLDAAQRLCIWGPSGSGKTTLLRLIAGLDLPDEGDLTFGPKTLSTSASAVPPHDRNIGFAFQAPALWPHMTVGENIRFGLHRLSAPEAALRLKEVLQFVELDGFEKREPSRLSGGEACRVALARALAPRPAILLLDEPLSSVEDDLRDRLLERLDHDLKAQHTSLIYVTHDRELAERLGGERILLREKP